MKNYHVELINHEADQLKGFLKSNNISYEASAINNSWLHFVVTCTEEAATKVNNFMDSIYA